MVSERLSRMCDKVELLTQELNDLTDGGHSRTSYAVIAVMKLSVANAELMYADLIERLCK